MDDQRTEDMKMYAIIMSLKGYDDWCIIQALKELYQATPRRGRCDVSTNPLNQISLKAYSRSLRLSE